MSLFSAHARVRAVSRRVSTAAAFLLLSSSLGMPLASSLAAQDSTTKHDSTAAHLNGPPDIRVFLQLYYRTGDPLNKDGFRMRKADIKFSGSLSPNLKWRLSFDAAKQLTLQTSSTDINDTLALNSAAIDQKTRLLQEAAMSYTFNKAATIDVG
jgi:hypothetical protein